jgi:hypothetical protein
VGGTAHSTCAPPEPGPGAATHIPQPTSPRDRRASARECLRKPAFLILALLSLRAPLALAAPGVNLYLGECSAGSSTTTVTNACDSNAGTAFTLYGSIVMPAVTRHQFVTCESILDIQTDAAGAIEDWWRADDCRSSAFILTADASLAGACATLWDTVAPAVSTLTAFHAGSAPPNRIRLLLDTRLDPGAVYDLVGDGATERVTFMLTVTRGKSLGPGACAGCSSTACIVLNETNLQTVSDTPATYLRLTDPVSNRYVTYNGSLTTAGCPGSVPARIRTWGAIKALYR